MTILYVLLAIFLIAAGTYVYFRTRNSRYFQSGEFARLQDELKAQIQELHELKEYANLQMQTPFPIRGKDYGQTGKGNVVECSLAVCDAAEKQPFKYLVKYFDVPVNERSLRRFEEVLNRYITAEQSQSVLEKRINDILERFSDKSPTLSRQRLIEELGLPEIPELEYPRFVFSYTSPGGNAGKDTVIVMDVDNLDRFVRYLSDEIKELPEERFVLTRLHREDLIERDHGRCGICGNSKDKEADLIFEIEHVLPLNQGGKTTEENLQSICWRCSLEKLSKA